MGDLNARVADEQTLNLNAIDNIPFLSPTRSSRDCIINTEGRKILKLLEELGGVILNGRTPGDQNGEFTFYRGSCCSVIDYCICSYNLLDTVSSFNVQTKEFSDHMPLVLVLSDLTSSQYVSALTLPPKMKWNPNYHNAYKAKLCAAVSEHNSNHCMNIDDKLKNINDKIKMASHNFAFKRKIEYKTAWYNSKCDHFRRKMLKSLGMCRKINLPIYRKQYKVSRSKYLRVCRERKRDFEIENISRLNTVRNPSEWWKLSNALKRKAPKKGNNLVSNDFRKHFSLPIDPNPTMSWAAPRKIDPFLDSPFEIHEVLLVLKKCKNRKAPGIDRITIEFYKYAPQCFLVELTSLFNQIFLRETIPDSFKNSMIVPFFKKGDPNCVENYRGLILSNSSYKIYAALILNRLNIWIHENNIIKETQAGFRTGYSTVDNIFNLTNIVNLRRHDGKKTYVLFVDFTCAFDSIPCSSMSFKLSILGLSSKMVNMISLLYQGNTYQVWDGTELAEPFLVNQGLRQGCPLSPTLFALYINDLEEALPGGVVIDGIHVKTLMYADDLALIAESPADLQLMIDALYNYCSTWGLSVNLNKSKAMIFRKGARLPANLHWSYNGQPIEIVKEYKYLGVILTYNLSFQKHLDERLKSSKVAICSTWLNYLNNPKIALSNKIKIFTAAARSILMYAAQIWGYIEFDQVEKLFRFFIKKILNLPNNTPNYALYLETHFQTQFSIAIRIHFSYVIKTLNMSPDRLPHKLALQTIAHNTSWFKEWNNILSNIGLPNLTINTPVSSIQATLDAALERIDAHKWDQFRSLAQASAFHDEYCNLNYDGPSYFNDNAPIKAISLVFRARTGLLNINARAFKKDTVGICTLCNLDAAENTYHFIGICPIFKSLRIRCFGQPLLTLAELHSILNDCNIDRLVKYLCHALKYRELLVNEFY